MCARSRVVPREFPAGSAFSYGNSPFLVVGRLIEVLGGADFATVVHQRLTGPLGMNDTTWPGAPIAANPAFGVQVTVDDYGKFLAMILHDGVVNGTRVLSSDAVRQMVSNQVGGVRHDARLLRRHHADPALRPRLLARRADQTGTTLVVSGNGGKGFYPWVDFTTRDLGDRRRAGRARCAGSRCRRRRWSRSRRVPPSPDECMR